MTRRHSLLNAALVAALCLAATSGARAAGGSDVKPLVLHPKGSDDVLSAGGMEQLRLRLQEKLGATADPSGDRVVRVVNRGGDKSAASGRKAASKHRQGSEEAGESVAVDKRDGMVAAAESGSVPMPLPLPVPLPIPLPSPSNSMAVAPVKPPVEWDYHGAGAPHKWAKLDPSYAACATGQRQSPIDIRDGIQVELEPIKFEYKPTAFSVIDTGRTVEVALKPGNYLTIMGRRYELVGFNFHQPAEEVVEGKRYAMVIHLLHKDAEGRLAMLAVLLDRGAAQRVVQTVWNNLPLEKREPLVAPVELDPAQLLPLDQRYFTYMGSLTTPPCTEGVLWMVLRQPMQVSDEQIEIFSRLYPMNARPLQAGADRLIKQN